MADVKWIKLSTQMFEDEKIRLIEAMPEADTLLIIWVKLLAQAGKTNASGYIFLSENIPYTEEMLAALFNRPLNTVRLALKTFQQFRMIEINEDNFICISNWEKHQNLQGLEKIREDTRKRVQKHRDKQKQLSNGECNVTVTENVTDKEEELEEEIEKELIPFVEIVNYLNQAANKSYRHSTRKTRDLIRARWNEGFSLGDFKKVVDNKCSEWLLDERMNQYLRPDTLFGTKFEGYLNQQVLPQKNNTPYYPKEEPYETSHGEHFNEYGNVQLYK